ncbi:MAG: hypothetical protein ACRDGM_18460 [bacterium]
MVVIARRNLLDEYFYFLMSLLVVVPVVYGFSFTIDKNLIHPAVPRPWVLYVHAIVFSGWLAFFTLQSGFVRARKTQWHRRAGLFGIVFGTAIPILGCTTAIAMGRFNTIALHATDAEQALIIPLFDMVCFTTAFALGVYWRKKPEFHRRLIFIATCVLTAAGFGRFPPEILLPYLFYGGVDLLILFGVARDLVVERRIHPVYLCAIPALVAGQSVVTYTFFHSSPLWVRIAHALLS